jgi:hypothetical protein
MGFPYSSGDVLTASDLNASSGLVFIKSQTIGTGVSSVTVSNVFSSTFYNYRVLLSSILTTAVTPIRMTVGTGATTYFFNRLTTFVNDPTGLSNSTNGYNIGYIEVGVGGTSQQGFVSLDIYAPAIARRTGFSGTFYGSGYNGFANAEHGLNAAHTYFTLTLGSGVFNGGEIYVYGYNGG